MQLPIEQIIEAMVDVVLVVDPSGHIPMSNAAAQQATGYSRAELAMLPVQDLLTDESSGLRTAVRRRVESGEALRRSDAWLTTKDGVRIPVSITAAPLTGQDLSRGIVLVVRENAEARRLLAERDAEIARREVAERSLRRALTSIETRLEQTRAHLLLSQRRASYGTLAAGLGSDLRDVVLRQRESLEILAEMVVPDHAASALAELAQIGEHLALSSRRLLEVAHPGTEAPRPVNLHRTIHEVIAMLKGAGSLHEHEIVYAFTDPPVFVTVHRPRLEQILVNLIVNAADAMREMRGTIMIAILAGPRPERICVEVGDTGPGIPTQILPRVFEPFFTTKSRSESMGLGLAVVRESVLAYGGDVTITSSPGIGASFTFDLPRSSDPERLL